MFPKHTGIPKKGFGSNLAFSNSMGFAFSSKEDSRNSARGSMLTQNKNFSPTGRSTYRTPMKNKDLKINSLMREIQDVREALRENKDAILDELPVFQETLQHEMQEMMLYFFDQLKNSQHSYARDFHHSIEALKNQVDEKEVVNRDLMETNRVLAQKNESLSKLLYNTTNQLNKVHSREASLDDPRDRSLGYTTRYSQKLLHESQTIAKSLKRPQNLNPFNSARLKTQIGAQKESTRMSSARLKEKARAFESQRVLTTETECAERLFSVENEEMSGRLDKKHLLTAGESSFVYVENEDAESNLLKSSVEQLVEDCQNYRKIALEENKKYVDALNALEIAGKEKIAFAEVKEKYEKAICENEDLIQKSQKALKQLNNLFCDVQSKGGENKEVKYSSEEIMKLQKFNEEISTNYAKSTQLLQEKVALMAKEKEILEDSLNKAKEEIGSLVDQKVFTVVASPRVRGDDDETTLLRTKLQEAQKEIEILRAQRQGEEKNEFEKVKKELEVANFKLSESGRLYEENYATHLDIINDLHLKLEILSEEFEQLRKIEDKEFAALKYSSKERDSTDSAGGELFLKLDNLEKSLHWYLEERKKLLSENNDLKVEINTLKEVKEESAENSKAEEEAAVPAKNEKEIQYEAKITELEEKIKRLGDIDCEMKEYKGQASTLEAKVLEIEASNVDLMEQNQQLEESLNTVSKEKHDLFKKVKENHDLIEELKAKIETLNESIDQLNKEKEAIKQSHEENSAHSESQKAGQIILLNQRLEEIKIQYEELKNEKEMFEKLAQLDRERSEELERQIEQVRDDYESRINEYENLMNEFRNSQRDQRDSEDEILNKYQTLQGMCDNFEIQCEQLVREKEELELELRMCQNENDELKRNMEELAIKYNIENQDEDDGDVDVI